jgi:hypothetical protein
MSGNRRSFGYLLAEVLLIVVGVFLGLAANEWRGRAAERATVEQALRSIRQEIVENDAELEGKLPYYAEMRASLARSAVAQGPGAPFDKWDYEGYTGFSIPLLRSSSYENAVATGAMANIDYELSDRLARTYMLQREYGDALDLYLAAFLNGRLDTLGDQGVFFTAAHGIGSRLAAAYEEALAALPPGEE